MIGDQLALLPPSGTLLDALRVVDRAAIGMAFVCDADGRLLGILTDGDVRRALLTGHPLDAPCLPHLNRTYISVGPEAERAQVLDLMQAHLIRQIPIVDAGGVLRGVHTLHEILGSSERPNLAVVMAGGKGTRLGALTRDTPKPMIRVAGRPILERIVLHLVGFGIRRIFLAINYLGHKIVDYFGDGSRFGCQIEYLREDRPLGTGGALSLLPARPEHPLLVMNGDLVTNADFAALLAFHERGGYKATVATRRYLHTVPFGCIDVDGERIVHIEEKPTFTRLVNAGIYVVSPDLLARVPQQQEFHTPMLLESCLANGEPVGAYELEGDWIDVGQQDQLKQARGET